MPENDVSFSHGSAKMSEFQSQPFKFIIGPEKREFFLHPEIVALHSKPLTRLIYGPMKEASQHSALLDDIKPETFARFAEYVYRGWYTAATHSISTTDSEKPPGNEDSAQDHEEIEDSKGEKITPESAIEAAPSLSFQSWEGWTSGGTPSNAWAIGGTSSTKRRNALGTFGSLTYPVRLPAYDTLPRANLNSTEDYSEVFLSHAEVYVFADQYDVEGLRLLALKRLHESLTAFNLFNPRLRDVTGLIQFVYENTAERSGTVDALRDLVTRYAACHVHTLRKDRTFAQLMRDGSAFSEDLLERLLPVIPKSTWRAVDVN